MHLYEVREEALAAGEGEKEWQRSKKMKYMRSVSRIWAMTVRVSVKLDGYPLFVKDALIGDVAEVKIIKAKKNYAYARLMHLITPSPHRVTPRLSGGETVRRLSDPGAGLWAAAAVQTADGGKQSAADRRP